MCFKHIEHPKINIQVHLCFEFENLIWFLEFCFSSMYINCPRRGEHVGKVLFTTVDIQNADINCFRERISIKIFCYNRSDRFWIIFDILFSAETLLHEVKFCIHFWISHNTLWCFDFRFFFIFNFDCVYTLRFQFRYITRIVDTLHEFWTSSACDSILHVISIPPLNSNEF